ncbi:hypothetical protein ACFL6M_03040 [Candidatus Eisenbacteria bacterium]|uniref:Tetratricopeptide repeat protein n=1 Tax=Eiseniibacteriota bacterium TaxID=2212470 RepID=A0ABV6YK56_UNCEI
MIQTALASLYHWSQREDCTDTNRSVGYWQVSRVYASAGYPDEARRYGRLCLDVSKKEGIPPFYLGYAYEALARVESLAGNRDLVEEYVGEARRAAESVKDQESKKLLLDDLETIG